jgi:Family of unknown function (DUF6152)
MQSVCRSALIVLGSGLLATALPASAHHSFAMYDLTKTETIEGTVKQYQWTNPHGWIFVNVPAADGKTLEYGIELTSPNLLMRRGWRPTSLKPGDKVTVILNPLRDGTKGGRIVSVTTPDGKVLTERG